MTSAVPGFDYSRAFARNLGLVTSAEQERLRNARAVVLGAGGVGGVHALSLARMGVGKFRIIDPDEFSLVNFNRQVGATMSTLGAPKASTIAAMVKEINPEAEVEALDKPLDASNVDAILDGVDVVMDGLDFFAVDARLTMFAAAKKREIHVVNAGPIGMSATLLVFGPGGMPFDTYFDIHPDTPKLERNVNFLVGVAPRASQRPYMDMAYSRPNEGYGPSLGAACMMCAGIAGIEALRIILKRPGLKLAPHYYQFDAYRQELYKGYLWWGNRHPLQLIKRKVARGILNKLLTA